MIIAADADLPRALLDERVALALPSLQSTRALAPLPVLGIPGWVADNEDPRYYDDTSHFRPGRRA